MLCSTFVYPYWFWLPAGQSTCAAESAGATVAGSFLGGVVAGGAAALLVVGTLCGSWKLKYSSGKSCKVNSEEEKWATAYHDVTTVKFDYVVSRDVKESYATMCKNDSIFTHKTQQVYNN